MASSTLVGHGDVEVLDARGDVGHDFRKLRLAVGPGAVGEHPHRPVIFADAVDAAGEMIFGAERGLQKAFDDLAVGEDSSSRCAGAARSQGMSAEAVDGASVSPSATALRAAASDHRQRNRRSVRIRMTLQQSARACKDRKSITRNQRLRVRDGSRQRQHMSAHGVTSVATSETVRFDGSSS